MEFSKGQVAALVLGYLKGENLTSVVNEFMKSCPYLEENSRGLRNGKYVVTRIAGLRLVDFLEQYALIYNIVHGRLEDTDYYDNKCSSSDTLVEKIMFLIDRDLPLAANLTPETSEVETTPIDTLPGNISNEEKDKTPQRNPARCRSRDREIVTPAINCEQLAKKIAENINMVRSTPEVGKVVSEEKISAGASKELDAVIKTVLQKTEEDPVYNNLIEEIVGTIEDEPCNNENQDSIDDHNNDAIRSIIEASQIPDPPPEPAPPTTENAPVYVYDGNLESYLKTSGTTQTINTNTNTVYFNPPLVVLPPDNAPPSKFFIVNNQPLINMNLAAVKNTVLTEKEIMSIPTIIVNDNVPNKKTTRRVRSVKAKPQLQPQPQPQEAGLLMTTTPKVVKKVSIQAEPQVPPTPQSRPASQIPPTPQSRPASQIPPTPQSRPAPQVPPTPSSRPASHVRNLDFSTPSCKAEPEKTNKKDTDEKAVTEEPKTSKAEPEKTNKKDKRTWDEDLRMLVCGSKDKSPSPRKKRPPPKKKKANNQSNQTENEEKNVEDKQTAEKEKVVLQTPVKDTIPKTPSGDQIHCTPFTDVLEEQLIGVDLSTIPTPSIPITPGFALTPGDLVPYNQRSTDYSTSSSYYQPSDTEQNRSIDQLIEECKRLESTSPPPDKFGNLKILSDVVIGQPKVPVTNNCSEKLKKFNDSVIGKKNLNLLKRQPTTSSSSSSDSDTDSEESNQQSNKTVIYSKNTTAKISDIINKVEVKSTLDKETRNKKLLSHLEEVRQRTIQKIKNPDPPAKKGPVRNNRKTTQTKKTKPATTRKNKKKEEENVEEKRKKLVVKEMAQRGIHLVPNKNPPKTQPKKPPSPPVDNCDYHFEKKVYDDFEIFEYDVRRQPRELSSYDVSVLQKSMSIKLFDDDKNEEVTRVIKWTNFETLLDKTSMLENKKSEQEIDDELMDAIFTREGSPETKPAKGGKKRKLKGSEDESKQIDKKSKTYENNILLLKKIDVDTFLDKVHGE